MSLTAMAIVSGVVLAAYVGCIAYGLLAPRKHHHPEDGMAIGCLTLAAIPAIVTGILVGIGVAYDVRALVRWPFVVCVIVFAYVLLVIIAQPIARAWRQRGQ